MPSATKMSHQNRTSSQVKCFGIILCWPCCTKQAKCTLLALHKWLSYKVKEHWLALSSEPISKISCHCLANYVKNLHQKGCCMCCKIIFHHSTSQIIDLWCSHCCCHRHFFNSLLRKREAATYRPFYSFFSLCTYHITGGNSNSLCL